MTDAYTFASATILLLLITDPLGNIPIFASALRHVAPERRTRVIVREVLIAFAVLLLFMFFGDRFLRLMNLSDTSLQIAGGVVLFLSAMAFVAVVVATWTSGKRIEGPAFEFAVPLEPVTSPGLWDRLGFWTVVGIVMVILAYAYPLATLIMTPRFGSPPFQPF